MLFNEVSARLATFHLLLYNQRSSWNDSLKSLSKPWTWNLAWRPGPWQQQCWPTILLVTVYGNRSETNLTAALGSTKPHPSLPFWCCAPTAEHIPRPLPLISAQQALLQSASATHPPVVNCWALPLPTSLAPAALGVRAITETATNRSKLGLSWWCILPLRDSGYTYKQEQQRR